MKAGKWFAKMRKPFAVNYFGHYKDKDRNIKVKLKCVKRALNDFFENEICVNFTIRNV